MTTTTLPTESGLRPELAAAAGYLGFARAELRRRLTGGATLASLARERGRSLRGLVETIVAVAKARLDAAVAAGRISEGTRDDILRDLRRRVLDAADTALPFPATAVAAPG